MILTDIMAPYHDVVIFVPYYDLCAHYVPYYYVWTYHVILFFA